MTEFTLRGQDMHAELSARRYERAQDAIAAALDGLGGSALPDLQRQALLLCARLLAMAARLERGGGP